MEKESKTLSKRLYGSREVDTQKEKAWGGSPASKSGDELQLLRSDWNDEYVL